MTRSVTLLLALALAACGSTGGSDAGPDATLDAVATPDASDVAGGDTAATDQAADPGAEAPPPADVADVPAPEPDDVPGDPGDQGGDPATPDVIEAETTPDVPVDTTPDDWHLQYGTPCPLDARVGVFEIGVDTYGLAAITGYVADRVNPLQVLEAKESDGPCTLLERPNPLCDPPCTGSQQCAAANQCVPYPENQDAGTVAITGLSVPVALSADGQGNYTKTDFDAAPFAPGANLELTATGGTTGTFSLQGEGVALLELPTKTWPFHAGEPLTIAWTPGNGVGTIRLNLNVDQHGVTPVTLVCDVPDTGSFTVPASMTTALWGYGVSGAPSSSIVRRTVDSVQTAFGCVELVVSHRVKTLIKVQ